ncbi:MULTISPECIES: ABC transporter permease [unclassified Variovorax]|uniref:ABC transporter permease n=1 Tax=unclassified Variovorax TaxID=663243 RepID=UPI000D13AC76|nr:MULTISPECIES: ABC transporter permease [unclassified Variovorax]AVQ85018.1 DNA-directed RNA polymerase subunit alpha [Variovorax sp. PMC12]QRY34635.1 ABC transporter permease [Variovorax sp. PDNC026]
METSTTSNAVNATASLAPVAQESRGGPRRWLGAFGASGLLGLAVLLFWVFAAAFGPWLLSFGTQATGTSNVFMPISAAHWLGTDYLGRDMLALVVQGARYTVGVALLATLVASGIGTTLALLAAASGRWLDATLSRGLDTLTAIPSKMFALIMVAGFGSSVPMLVATAAIIYVPGAFRIARSLAVNINALDYVTVARARGEGTLYIMLREILPNIVGPMLADLGLRFVYIVLLLASLSFLGLGIQPPAADWGSLVRENIGALAMGGASVIVPALAIASLTISVNLVIDNLPGRAAREMGKR